MRRQCEHSAMCCTTNYRSMGYLGVENLMTTDGIDCYDNTRLTAYRECPRKYFLRHVMHWRAEGTAMPLVFGGAWHAAMDIVWKHYNTSPLDTVIIGARAAFDEKWMEAGLPDPDNMSLDDIRQMEPRTPPIAYEMLSSYVFERARYLSESEVLSIEQPFAVPLPNLNGKWYVGRLDKVIKYQGTPIVFEHKTTTAYSIASGFRSDYVESWYSDSQIKGYLFGGGLLYPELHTVMVDAALVHKKVHNEFRLIPVDHQFDIVKEFLGYTENWVKRINEDQLQFDYAGVTYPHVFPKNEGQCFGKWGRCVFVDVCRTQDKINKDDSPPHGFIVEEWKPFETLGIEKVLGPINRGPEPNAGVPIA